MKCQEPRKEDVKYQVEICCFHKKSFKKIKEALQNMKYNSKQSRLLQEKEYEMETAEYL